MVRNILLVLNDEDYDKFEKDKIIKKYKSWNDYFLNETNKTKEDQVIQE